MQIACPPPNVGPYLEQLYVEVGSEIDCRVWDSFTGTQPGLLTNENTKADALYRYAQL